MFTPTGIHAILYAFFDAHGRLDRTAMRRQTEACIAAGCDGLAILGLATEVSKLTGAERHTLVEWAVQDLQGRLPLAVTIFGETPAQQQSTIRHAEQAGAAWLILQPPPRPGMSEPDLMGLGLSPTNLARLARAHPNLRALKAEGPATQVAEIVAATGLPTLNGRGGLELPDTLRAGALGNIPAPDVCDLLVRCHRAYRSGDPALADQEYARALPAIAFVMQGIHHLTTYGKRLTAARLALGPVHDRAPALPATPFGEACVTRFAAKLGPLPT